MDEQLDAEALSLPRPEAIEATTGGRRLMSPRRLAVSIMLFGLVIVGLVTWLLQKSYDDNEDRLLRAKAKETAALITSATTGIQTPLAAAAELADASGGNREQFTQFMNPYVGPKLQFVSASLWNLKNTSSGPLVLVGDPPLLAGSPQAPGFFARIGSSSQLELVYLPSDKNPRIGYEYHPAGKGPYAVYTELALPSDRRARIARDSAFSNLHYAIYFGKQINPDQLLTTDLDPSHPITLHRIASQVIPFGAGAFTIAVSPRGSLGGALAESLPWIFMVVGLLLSVIATLVGHRLQLRRREAERMAAALNRAVNEARSLYSEQRSVAHHLERSLIPDRLPDVPGLESACRYEPGATGVEIGGDWYDLVPLRDDRVFFVIGDVSGRGVAAAAVMARLRFAVLAYVQVGFPPAGVLNELSNLISMEEVGHFATMVCGVLDLRNRELVLANAGHLPPLLLVGHETEFLAQGVGIPIGVSDGTKYDPATVKVPPSATLLMYTDGLVERRTERIEAGMNRLAGTALQYRTLRLETQINKIVEEMTRPGSEDDAALLGIRWQS